MPIYSKHLKTILRGLKYQTLDKLIGREVEICSLKSVQADIFNALGKYIPIESYLISPKEPYLEGAMAKYGIIDAEFSTPSRYLEILPRINRNTLEDIGFAYEKGSNENFSGEDTLFGFESLAEDVGENKAFIKLFLELDSKAEHSKNVINNIRSFKEKGMRPKLKLPKDFFPNLFIVEDACLTNSDFVWINKHFYL